jgi:outer membrane lipoprotein-sorting protein
MRTLTARPALRWLVPLVVLLTVLASFLVTSRAKADTPLPPIEAQDLLVKVADAQVDGLSGTVVQNADLGIPAIPGGSDSPGGKLTSLLAGSHTMRVWYGAPDQARLAVNDQYAETDIVSNGTDLWTYDSRAKEATHTTMAAADPADRTAPQGAPQTPQDAAKEFLAKVTPTTDVRVDPDVKVAGQDAYELVLSPKDAASLVKQVRIAVDGKNYVPLRVQVFGPGDKAALDVAYTDVTFGQPDARMFAFNPPEGTKVTQKAAPEPTDAQKKALADRQAQADQDRTVVGSGWSAVVITKLPSDAQGSSNETLKGFLDQLKPVSGSWGSGRELDGTVLTAIVTDDGRLAVGAVGPDAVSSALAR